MQLINKLHINKKPVAKTNAEIILNSNEIPRTMSGLGVTILSTPKGVITDKEARKLNVGGELICSVS